MEGEYVELQATRPKDKSAQDNSAHKKVDPRQLVPSRPNFRRQIAPTLEDLSAHENETRHLLMY